MKAYKWKVIHRYSVNEEPKVLEEFSGHRLWREKLTTHACRLFGVDGKDFRIVQDSTIIGFHVRALSPSVEGDTLEIV